VKFLIDNQLPPGLARVITAEFECEALHVTDVGLRDGSDKEVWSFASANDLIVVSKDEDFTNMILELPTARLIWVRIGNCTNPQLFGFFRQVWPEVVWEHAQDGRGVKRPAER
jgi:predicted nuclease of predicted toxin-antitoxin system